MNNNTKNLAKIFKVLSNENRLKILLFIYEKESKCEKGKFNCQNETVIKNLAKYLKITIPTTSHHVKELLNAGLIATKKKGRWVYCNIDRNSFYKIRIFLNKFNQKYENTSVKRLTQESNGINKEKAKIIREAYGKIVKSNEKNGCCSEEKLDTAEFAKNIGYLKEELSAIPAEANLGLGCGNPTALANLKEGETVLDLGSGAGMDCFLAASKVGKKGKAVGVDMVAEMVKKARENARKNNIKNVEFRHGKIEDLPVADSSIDVVTSNCVINLVADKPKVFKEVYRVLRPGGRLAVSDIALLKKLPRKIKKSVEAYVGCVGGAMLVNEYKKVVETEGLKNVKVKIKGSSECITPNTKDPVGRAILDNLKRGESLNKYVVSIYVEGYK